MQKVGIPALEECDIRHVRPFRQNPLQTLAPRGIERPVDSPYLQGSASAPDRETETRAGPRRGSITRDIVDLIDR